jgi:hypothetical protein
MKFHDVIRHLVAHCPFSDEDQVVALAAVDEHEAATGQLPDPPAGGAAESPASSMPATASTLEDM